MARMTGGDAVYHALRALEVECVFGIVSVHNIPIYDAILRHGGIRTVDARHEQAAVHMADAYARTTGKLGVAITSTGPGAANAVPGLFEAGFASSPVLMLTGQIETRFYGKGKGFLHEAERQLDMLRAVTRRSESLRRAEGIVGAVLLAARDALDGRAQPVAVEIPVDLQYREIDGEIPAFELPPPLSPDPPLIESAAELLAANRRRVIVAGGGVHQARAHRELRELAERLRLPVFTSVNGRGALPEDHPLCVGVLQGPPVGGTVLPEAFQQAEVVLAVGTRFQASATSNWEMELAAELIHLDVDPGVVGRNYRPGVALIGDARTGLAALAAALGTEPNDADFNDAIAAARVAHRQAQRKRIGPDHCAIMDAIRELLPAAGNVVRDATIPAYTWGNQLLPILAPYTSINTTSAAIGPGLPLAIGAAFGSGQPTVLLQGDGGFMLHIGELATAAQYRLPIVVCLFNDHGYGVLRLVQSFTFDGRTTGVDLHTPDFVAVARGMGVTAEPVASAAAFAPALARALATEGPTLLEIDAGALAPIRLLG